MHLSFSTKMFGRSVQLSSNFGKTFSYVRDACWYKDNVYQADIYRKNNTCTSCVFNGFKYISMTYLKTLTPLLDFLLTILACILLSMTPFRLWNS